VPEAKDGLIDALWALDGQTLIAMGLATRRHRRYCLETGREDYAAVFGCWGILLERVMLEKAIMTRELQDELHDDDSPSGLLDIPEGYSKV
jgi:hypothetical protein